MYVDDSKTSCSSMMNGCPATSLRIEISRIVACRNVRPWESSRSAETSIILAANSRPVSFSTHRRTVDDTPLDREGVSALFAAHSHQEHCNLPAEHFLRLVLGVEITRHVLVGHQVVTFIGRRWPMMFGLCRCLWLHHHGGRSVSSTSS